MPRLWPRRDQAPPLWGVFCEEWLLLPRNKLEQWWQALTQARWSRAVELRSMVQCQNALATDWRQVMRLYEGTMAPKALLEGLEDLIKEGVMAPLTARRIEDKVLAQTNTEGRWK